jgi:scyllo-inositol 2-dehydrogenase (NADP+)
VYVLHVLVYLFGRPESIQAFSRRLGNGLDAQGTAVCSYPEMLADVSWSKIADGRRENEIQGEKGTILFDAITNPKHIRRIGRDGSSTVLYEDPDGEFFGMAHEISAFLSFADLAARSGDRPWEAFNRCTEQTLSLMDEIRRQNGIDFSLQTP